MPIDPITADFAPYLATDSLRLYRSAGTGDCLVLSLSGVGKDFSAWPPLEFVRYANANPQHHFLFVADRNRSWLNDEALAQTLCAEVRGYVAAQGLARIVTLGNSMGGFMALALAPLLGAGAAIAFSPQFSVDPEVVPDEHRWQQFRSRIKAFRFRDLSASLAAAGRCYLFHGDTDDEQLHWRKMPYQSAGQHYIFPGHSHFMVRWLHDRQVLHPIIDAAINNQNRRLRALVEASGGMKRHHFEQGRQSAAAADRTGAASRQWRQQTSTCAGSACATTGKEQGQ